MDELIESNFEQGPQGISSEIAGAADAFVTFKLLRSELKFVPAEEFQDAAADLSELAVEQRALLDGLTPADRCMALNLGYIQLNAGMGPEIPGV